MTDSEGPNGLSSHSQTGAVITKIEEILGAVVDGLAHGDEELSLPFRNRTATTASQSTQESQMSTGPGEEDPSPRRSRHAVTFPGRTAQEAKKFVAVLRILELSLEALVTGKVITKRHIYYQHTELFREQRVVDVLVDDLAFTLGVGRDALNIVAAAKGLVAGPLTLLMRNGSTAACGAYQDGGVLIPHPRTIAQLDLASARWVLVVEKEAIFRTLAATRFWATSVHGHGVLVTGKGFPDLTTRAFINLIHTQHPEIVVYGLVDFDPDGMSILRTYKYGSRSLGHEDNCTAPRLAWLGIKTSDILNQSSLLAQYPEDFLTPLTARDRKIGANLLTTMCGIDDHDVEELEQLRELQTMLFLNIKAEIQAVDNLGDLTGWLEEKMSEV